MQESAQQTWLQNSHPKYSVKVQNFVLGEEKDMKLLLAEDTADLNRALCAVLSHEGYEVTSSLDGEDALAHIMEDSFDIVILDIMMPKKTGMEVLEEMRRLHIITPVLMLTAKAEVDDRVAGLDAGADDYLTKPFAMKELLARVRSLTRRRRSYETAALTFGTLHLSPDTLELSCENTVRLSIREFEMMQELILNADRPLETSWLLSRIWSDEPDADEETVWFYISYLRRKLDAVASTAVIIGEKGGTFCLVQQ